MTLAFEKMGVNLVVVLDEPAIDPPAIAIDQWREIFEDPSVQIEAMAVGLIRVLSMRQQAELILQPGRVVIADKSAVSPTSEVFPRIAANVTKLLADASVPVNAYGYNIDLTFDPKTSRSARDELGVRLLRPEVAAVVGALRCNATLHYEVAGSARKLQLEARFSKPDTTVIFGSLNAEYGNGEPPQGEDAERTAIGALVAETEATLEGLFESGS